MAAGVPETRKRGCNPYVWPARRAGMALCERHGTRSGDGEPATEDRWTCEYCERRFAAPSRARDAYDMLVAHIRDDCPAVPAAVRARYRSRCAGGRCGR